MTFAEFQPTVLDPVGNGPLDRQDWLVVIGRTRDDEELEVFDEALAALGGESDDVAVCRFDHWAIGWFEIILVRPGSDAANRVDDVRAEYLGV